MKKSIVAIVTMAVLSFGAAAFAANITIPDTMAGGTNSWYTAGHEDQEVEPGMGTGQRWDLEAFMFNGSILQIVGGFNMKDGYQGILGGDLFVDVNGNAQYGSAVSAPIPSNAVIQRSFGYDYAVDFDFANNKFTAYAIDDTAYVRTVDVSGNFGSNPFEYVRGGQQVATGAFTFESGLSDEQVGGLIGDGYFYPNTHDSHYRLSLDLTRFLAPATEFTSHYTMTCGNDDLMGHATVPEPGTLMLFGTGIVGLMLVSRRKI